MVKVREHGVTSTQPGRQEFGGSRLPGSVRTHVCTSFRTCITNPGSNFMVFILLVKARNVPKRSEGRCTAEKAPSSAPSTTFATPAPSAPPAIPGMRRVGAPRVQAQHSAAGGAHGIGGPCRPWHPIRAFSIMLHGAAQA